jgi:VIT1/CCC1 family predicted Fe2+/Mn2+ transporter
MLNKILQNLVRLDRLEEITAHAEADYERESENLDYEQTFARAYSAEFNAKAELVDQLSRFAGMDEKTARALIVAGRQELVELLKRAL